MPDCDGLDGLLTLRRHFPDLRIVMLSMHAEERFALGALRAGAMGYVSKAAASTDLVQAVRQASTGQPWLGPRVDALLAERPRARQRAAHHVLTPRESEIITLIGTGLQVKQVAAELGISVSSVNTYRSRIFRKMGLNSNAALIRYALQHGLAG
jgi:two-component system invasion response regulator UvrY